MSSSSCLDEQDEQLNIKEKSLRRFLEDKPRNARKMSELALLLLADKSASALRHDNNNSKEEALQWAQRAIQVAPMKPYGYAALSVVLLENDNDKDQYDRRIQALQAAIQYIAAPTPASTATSSSSTAITRALWVTRAVLLVRLLWEPRIHESFEQAGASTTSSKTTSVDLHPNRRQLDAKENALYQKIQTDLSVLYSASSLENNNDDTRFWLSALQHETLALRCDYRLGLFLRKKLPAHVYRPLARFHFQRVVERLETLSLSSSSSLTPAHPKLDNARFWLATMSAPATNNADKNSSTVVATTVSMMTMDRCPKDYVIGLYATFADRFDDLLVNKLDYQTPTLLCQLVQQQAIITRKGKNGIDCTARNDIDDHDDAATMRYSYFHKAVDLGCGTGLSGMAFRHLIAPPGRAGGSLTGVDLSPEMIAKAKQRTWCPCHRPILDEQSTNGDSAHQQSLSCYDVLLVGDLELALDIDTDDDNDSNRYALIFACDVFCYIGNLKQIFQRVYNALTKHGGIFAFSVESLQPVQQQISQPTGTLNMVPFQLHECARFAHSQDYLNDLASDCGFTILTTQTCPIRKNQGENVMGLLYVLEKDVRGS